MDNIIQQISEKLTKKILEKAYSGGICDIDSLSSSVLEDCKSAARDILEAIVSDLNIKIRKDKPSRKARGLILERKEQRAQPAHRAGQTGPAKGLLLRQERRKIRLPP